MSKKRRRNSLRHPHWDYHREGCYFVTICTHRRVCVFDQQGLRRIAEGCWEDIPRYKSPIPVCLDEWVVMPNHVHGIFRLESPEDVEVYDSKTKAGAVWTLVGTYKAAVAKRINGITGSYGTRVWQRGFYDRIIRDERELEAIRYYIRENPKRWAEDRDNLDSLVGRMSRR